MSFEAMTWAVQIEVPAKQKIVLLMLANRVNKDDGKCVPSMDRLSRDCGLSKASVKRAIKDLEDADLIEVIHRREGPTMLSNQYRLKMGGVGSHRPRGGVTVNRGVGSHRTPNQRLEPENEPKKGEINLFSEMEEPEKQDETPDLIEDGFNEFWDNIWPSHKRKTGKVDCRKVYRKACEGKHDKAEQVSPADLNMAARRYIASVEDRQYLKGPLPWLRAPGWEPFLAAPEPKPLSFAQRVLRDYGNGGRGSGASAPQVGGPEKNANGAVAAQNTPPRGHSGEPERLSFAQRVIQDYGRAAE